ncbi:MAG TPA: hypothetical protein V6C58_10595 [Allocoleopsis sp.]
MLNGVDSECVEVNNETREDCLINVILEITRLKFCAQRGWSPLYVKHRLINYLRTKIIRDLRQFFPTEELKIKYLSDIHEFAMLPMLPLEIAGNMTFKMPSIRQWDNKLDISGSFYVPFNKIYYEVMALVTNGNLELAYQEILNRCIEDDQNSQYLNDMRRQKQFQLEDYDTRMTRYRERVCNEYFKNKETKE